MDTRVFLSGAISSLILVFFSQLENSSGENVKDTLSLFSLEKKESYQLPFQKKLFSESEHKRKCNMLFDPITQLLQYVISDFRSFHSLNSFG